MADTPIADHEPAQQQQAGERETAEDVHDCWSMFLGAAGHAHSVSAVPCALLKVRRLSSERPIAGAQRPRIDRPGGATRYLPAAHDHRRPDRSGCCSASGSSSSRCAAARAARASRCTPSPKLGQRAVTLGDRGAVRLRPDRAGARAGVQRRAQGERRGRRPAPERRRAEGPRTVRALLRRLPHAGGGQVGRPHRPEPRRARRRRHLDAGRAQGARAERDRRRPRARARDRCRRCSTRARKPKRSPNFVAAVAGH